jgi:hypothetical protein
VTNVGAIVFAELSAAPDVVAVLGTAPMRLYPNRLRQGTTYPAATYQIVNDVPAGSLGGYTARLRNVRMQVDAYGQTYTDADDVADAVCEALKSREDVKDGLRWTSRMVLRRDLWEATTSLHRVSVDFQMWIEDPP